jgi:photosystem II stability/assembly factor-like uncharacterized protein
MLTWTPIPNVNYWIFTATDPNLTAFNWTALPNAHAYVSATTPYYVCGLINGKQTYFAANGRVDGGPGGASSATVSATPYDASANAWPSGTTTPTTPNLLGVGYTGLTTCGNNTALSATGAFATVGAGGAIFTSTDDGQTWNAATSPISSDLYAVTGYAANQNNPTNPALHWVAVGNGGAAVYSLDGTTWAVGRNYNVANPALRSITQVAGTFFAAGDSGTILSSTDGITWTTHNSPSVSSSNLNGITHGGIYVAVGDGGTILASGDGNTWAVRTSPTTQNLRQVTSFVSIYGTIYVAVGDAGTIVTSIDGGTTWIKQAAPTGSPDLVGVTVESRGVETTTAYTTAPTVDPKLGFISSAQFVAIDNTGHTYTSKNGYDWSTASATTTNTSCTTGTTCMNPLVSSGFGYVTVGNSGAYATSF